MVSRSVAWRKPLRRASIVAAVLVLGTTEGAAAQGSAQNPHDSHTPPATAWTVPRTPWGDPDLQGIWPSRNMAGTPFERPVEYGERRYLTDEEFAERQKQIAEGAERVIGIAEGRLEVPPPREGDVGGGPQHWGENWQGEASRLTSLIVDPPNGRMPPKTPDGERRAAAAQSTYSLEQDVPVQFNGPEDLGLYDRCITRGVLRSTFPTGYNMGIQIVQAPGYVAIVYEMIHETRVIPLDGRPHTDVRSYMGDPRGRWEGDTLVVETRSFKAGVGALRNGHQDPMSEALRLTERFTRVDAHTIQYEVTIDDPETWVRPWSVAFPLKEDPSYGMYEYACHEGNHAMRNILSGARAAEARRPPE